MQCECGTCSIRFSSRKDFNEILNHQPIGMDESIVLKNESKTNLYLIYYLIRKFYYSCYEAQD